MRTVRTVTVTVAALILASFALCYAFLRSGGLSARRKPGGFEYAVAGLALNITMPAAAKSVKNPVAPGSDALAAGTKIFSENCAVCHGNDGAGRTNTAKGLSPEVPDLRAKHVQELTDGEMFYVIRNGIRFTGMPGWNLGDDQIWKLVLATRQLAKDHAASLNAEK
jgi:mono/diheme cytochrome c family protein